MLIWEKKDYRRWVGIAAGAAAAVTLLAACADSSQVTKTKRTNQPAVRSASGPMVNDRVVPASHTTTPSGSAIFTPTEIDTALIGPVVPQPFQNPLDPADITVAWQEGVRLYEEKDYTGAVVALQIAAEGLSQEPYTQYLLGLALWKSGDNDGAERFLVRSSELDGGSVRTFINLARVRMDNHDPRGALDATSEALAIDAASSDALHQRGRALAGLNRADAAIETLLRAHALAPEDGYIANTLGYVLIQAGRPEEALPFLESARDSLPEVAYVRNNLGVAFERTGAIEPAMVEYRAAVEAGDSEGKALASVARLEPLVERIIAERGPVQIDSPEGDTISDGQPLTPETQQASMEIDTEKP